MEWKESIDVLGNLGEFLGAVAVLATLGYLVVQTKQNTSMLKTSIYYSHFSSRTRGLEMAADHAAVFADIYTQPNKPFQDLDPVERTIHQAYFTHVMNYSEETYLHHLDGVIDDAILENNRRQLTSFFSVNSLHRQSWDSQRRRLFDPRFVEWVENSVMPDVEAD